MADQPNAPNVDRGILVFCIWSVLGFLGLAIVLEGFRLDSWALSAGGVATVLFAFVAHIIVNAVFATGFSRGETALGIGAYGLLGLIFVLGAAQWFHVAARLLRRPDTLWCPGGRIPSLSFHPPRPARRVLALSRQGGHAAGGGGMIWLPLYLLFYAMVALYWARLSARANGDHETYFSAGHHLAPWVSALVLAGASVSGWLVLGGTEVFASQGFGLPGYILSGIALAMPGVFFFKRFWLIAQRLRLSSQAEVLRSYYQSEFLVVVSATVAVLFAVAFAGMQLRALSRLLSFLTDGQISVPVAAMVLSSILFGYVVIGGMRAVGYLGAIQTVLLGAVTAWLRGLCASGRGWLCRAECRLARSCDRSGNGSVVSGGGSDSVHRWPWPRSRCRP